MKVRETRAKERVDTGRTNPLSDFVWKNKKHEIFIVAGKVRYNCCILQEKMRKKFFFLKKFVVSKSFAKFAVNNVFRTVITLNTNILCRKLLDTSLRL